MRTFAKLSLLVILAMAVCAPMMAQGPMPPIPPPGKTINWTINLASPVAEGATGTAQYTAFFPASTIGKTQIRFSVECEYLVFPAAGTVLDVFLRIPGTPTANDGKYIGRMVVQNGSASLLLLTSNAPVITKGTEVVVMIHDGPALMIGTF